MDVDERPHDSTKENSSSDKGKTEKETRGHILQRHKLEHKNLKSKLQQMKQDRLRLSKHSAIHKSKRKAIGKDMKSLLREMSERHRKELEDFEKLQSVKPSAGGAMASEVPQTAPSDVAILPARTADTSADLPFEQPPWEDIPADTS
eukprot:CAMPEP_0196660990 /NCGR_PEP_ID=MMETSP1086-20130531/42110_1 /TAXON_ID=77921 /ORGANISM="Cyanoptyche  gloeocystis , Strain SAG4.97" /LENGTH=146 /DNA_ID=CAMNT_0041995675 /DNA_START=135 /DNA_END=575 /DNA_ORIENTATION=-